MIYAHEVHLGPCIAQLWLFWYDGDISMPPSNILMLHSINTQADYIDWTSLISL